MMLSRAVLLKCGLAFAGIGIAATFIARDDEQQVAGAPAARPHARSELKSAKLDAPLDLSLLNRAPTTELEENVFGVPRPPAPPPAPVAPPPPPPPPVVAAPPPKPTAPALPFRFLGRMVDGGATTLFVAQGNQNLSIRQGDVVNDTYRLEQIGESSATFVYIPLQERQTLTMGSKN